MSMSQMSIANDNNNTPTNQNPDNTWTLTTVEEDASISQYDIQPTVQFFTYDQPLPIKQPPHVYINDNNNYTIELTLILPLLPSSTSTNDPPEQMDAVPSA